MAKQHDDTVVTEVDLDNMDDIFGTGDAAVMTEDKEKKFFARPGEGAKEFFDKPAAEHAAEIEDEKPPVEGEEKPADGEEKPKDGEEKPADGEEKPKDGEEKPKETPSEADIAATLDPENVDKPSEEDEKNAGGRPTKMEAVMKQLLEKKLIKPFEGEEDFSKYTEKDIIELFEMNAKSTNEGMQKNVEEAFFKALSPRLQQAYHYIAQGGQDEIALFHALAASEEMKQLDISTPEGQEEAVRQYYQVTKYGNSQEIQAEINKLKDRGELEEKAGRFKPKLDEMQESVVQQKLQTQEAQNKQKHGQMQVYMDSVYTVLEKAEVNGLQLEANVQDMLYEGLVNPKYPSISGKSTNLLGALLEKYQWVEPNHELVAEVLYLLADPEGYRTKVRESAKEAAVKETVRTLKAEEASKGGGAEMPEEKDENGHVINKGSGIQRKKNNFFARKKE